MIEDNHLLENLKTEELVLSKSDGISGENNCNKKYYDIASTNRDMWTSKTEFLLSCIGYAVGLGNIWHFPYLCYRSGGGAFLVPYLLMLLLCGIPLYFVEMSLGQFASVGCTGIFRLTPLLKGTGYAVLIVNFICACYCSVILSYAILFIYKIFSTTLPWLSCSNNWNTAQCVDLHELSQHNITNNSNLKIAADEFFQVSYNRNRPIIASNLFWKILSNEILKISTGIDELGGIVWPLFWCLVIACLVLYVCIIKGIKSTGKVVYFSATFPYFILIVLFIRGVTLPGSMKGIMYYFNPEWSRLLDLRVWSNAALQIFFSLGPGWGGLVIMASFNNCRNSSSIKKDIFIIPIINCSTSIFAGFVVFSVLGYLSDQTGIPVEAVATNGPGLVFVTYPQAIAMLPLPHLWAALFFIMLFLLGLDTIFVQLETITTCCLDEIPKLRKYSFAVPMVLCLCTFIGAIVMVTRGGMYVLHLLDTYSSSLTLMSMCILETVMVAWIYGIDNFLNDIQFMIDEKPAYIWKYSIKYVLPMVLIFIFVTNIYFLGNISYNGIEYPDWAVAVGWLSCFISIICIPLYMIYIICSKKGSYIQKLRGCVEPIDWKPARRQDQNDYEYFKNATRYK